MEKYYKKWFKPLLLPAVILFVGVIIIPFIIGVFYSFSAWRGTYFHGGANAFESFVGLRNYIKVFQNSQFLDALLYTLKFTLMAVIAVSVAGLVMAMMISVLRKGSGVYRTIFFMPNLLGGLALGFIWQFIFQIVYSKMLFGEEGLFHIPFLTNMTQDSTKTLVALVIMVVWQMAGYMMLIFVAGINNISSDLYEAASIDGAGAFTKFRKITLPMLMPSFTIVLFLTLSNCFKLLDQNVALTDGNFNTRLLALQILRTTKDTRPPDYGLAQAQAVIFFILIAIVGLIQVSYTKKKEVEM
ncbi:carbohydrate ABC transporter permease [uncultured Robinsoniella sp.]|uniref:carbohydrate ABC transporter permease n=1 Tax=uncultured Robinsoniella sp. TaxID=904190 RepID=UPI00374F473C